MRLITGPAGSGKTSFVLNQFRESLDAGNEAVRLLVPTATMAQHLQNLIAREGFVFRSSLIQTLSGFIESRAADFPQAPESVLYLLVEDAVARVNRPEFRRVAGMPGFCAALARTISEFSSAGCDSARLAACAPEAPLGAAFLAVYEEVDRALDRKGLLLRGRRLELAAARIHAEGLGGIKTVWMDGFHALPDPELAVIAAVGRHAAVTVTLADGDPGETVRGRLLAMGYREERMAKKRGTAAIALVRASGIEREVEEIARRILEQASAGRPFREMGIIVRPAETYVPLLRAILERFGIPARFYFETDGEQHPAARFLTGAIDAMLSGWDHPATLRALRLAPRFADSAAMDRFDFDVRERIPNAGLGGLKALLAGADSPLARLIESLAALEEWRSFEMTAADWAARFRTLRNVFRPLPPCEGANHAVAMLWRSQAAALDLFEKACEEAAQALDPERRMGMIDFWRTVKSVLRLHPLRLNDGRRNVVQVLSAHEARQWVLPIVFVCGLVEKQFPQFQRQDPFFHDSALCQLNAAGVRVRTAAEFEREERALFDSALTRATMLVTLSYPEFDARGDRTLPSLFLEPLGLTAEPARAVRPAPRERLRPGGPPAICAPGLLAILGEKTARISPSGLDSYLQCPFQYFGGRTLRLKTRPKRPEERLNNNFLLQGEIVHAVLAEWYTQPQEIGPLFQRVFEECCGEHQIPPGYHTERLRNTMLENLERFAGDVQWPRANFVSQTELDFDFPLNESVRLFGRIDRLDTAPDGRAYVIDYKYSPAKSVEQKRKGDGLQAPVYVLAAEKALGVRPAGIFFVGLKGGVAYQGWSEDFLLEAEALPKDWQEETGQRVLRIVEEIRQGRVAPLPANADQCPRCDARDVCRIETQQAVAVAGGA
jgi:ATP-dependent helicase/DNAse subunit B